MIGRANINIQFTHIEYTDNEYCELNQVLIFILTIFRRNRNSHQLLVHNNANSVRNSNYQGNRPTNVIVHGWNQNGGDRMNVDITSALLDLGDFNVIVIDWRSVAGGSYFSAANQVPAIGNHVGNVIQWIFNNFGGNLDQLHLIGFSLGAHIVGNAGRALGGRPIRVTGKLIYQELAVFLSSVNERYCNYVYTFRIGSSRSKLEF